MVGLLRSNFNMYIKQGAFVLILSSVFITIFDMVELHPYQSVYFNRVVAGGLKTEASRFETDYWGNSYKEGVEWVIENYSPHLKNKPVWPTVQLNSSQVISLE
jgi:hypothetical protein